MATHPQTDLLPYLRGELGPIERERLARHLESCPACRTEASALREVLGELARSVPAAPAISWPRWRAELGARLDQRRTQHPWWWRPIPLALSASLAGVLVFLAVLGSLQERAGSPLTSADQALLGTRLELFQQLSLVEQLDLLEDLDVIRQLDGLAATSDG